MGSAATNSAAHKATIKELMRTPGKAELVNGEIVPMSPTGGRPNYAAGEIFVNLRQYARQTRTGYAVSDNAAFRVNLPHRKSFSPDVAYWTGHAPTMSFYEGAPVFAVEVRSENDYGPQAEQEMAQKRADYFAAGTLVVWDVDLESEEVIRKYTAAGGAAQSSSIFRRSQTADAAPAIPGWTMPVDDLFVL